MSNAIKTHAFLDIENLISQIAVLEWDNLKLEVTVAKLKADLELNTVLKNCELTNLIYVK